jgi:uncharacterized protein YqgC (DUF456 family)
MQWPDSVMVLAAATGSDNWLAVLLWAAVIGLLVVGLLGSLLPILPGPGLIFAAALMQSIWQPQVALSAAGWTVLLVFLALSFAVDFAAGAMGARWFGASFYGVLGSLLGAVVGLAFMPLGLLIGPLALGFAFEIWLGGKRALPAMRITLGALVGTGLGLILRLLLAVLMVATVMMGWWR